MNVLTFAASAVIAAWFIVGTLTGADIMAWTTRPDVAPEVVARTKARMPDRMAFAAVPPRGISVCSAIVVIGLVAGLVS